MSGDGGPSCLHSGKTKRGETEAMKEKNPIRKWVRFLMDVIVMISLAWLVVHSFLSQTTISGHSMEPGISAGDIVLVDILSYRFFAPRRMDIVIFQRGGSAENVKRVVGLPGETVTIQNGSVYIDGKLLDKQRVSNIALPGIAANPVELQQDEYFLIGDNADSSEDSRFQNVGNVKRSQISGRVWFRLLPFRKFGPLPR
ncbi:signal peptidase I [Oribacterium sp. oral taxon 078 str. F0263]|nr:signal peptidase I [Oribacterium sp. oral taxon 078 str. F0263]